MTPNVVRWVLGAGALALHMVLFAQQEAQPWFWISHPIAPPLTHLQDNAEATLAPPGLAPAPDGKAMLRVLQPAIAGSATRGQSKRLARAAKLQTQVTELQMSARSKRLDIQQNAADIMKAVGTTRITLLNTRRAAGSKAMGEAWVWSDAASKLEAVGQ